ncbi:MAG: hypothetical protein ABSC11_02715 [Smithella sp.]|jgi:hypothetical protein
MNIEKIRESATDFRNAIEVCAPSLGIIFESFPRGSCGETVLLLGTYLIEQGLGEFQYMLVDYGIRKDLNWSSHAWLQLDNLVVDITADQFPEITEKVIVQEFSKWHLKLNGTSQNIADYRIYNAYTISFLSSMYLKIIGSIKQTSNRNK